MGYWFKPMGSNERLEFTLEMLLAIVLFIMGNLKNLFLFSFFNIVFIYF